MDQYKICKERAEWIGQEIGKLISHELELGHQDIQLRIINDDPGMDYVMVEINSTSKNIMIDAQEEREEWSEK